MGERDSNRAAFPATARIIDELREVFGPDVKLVWAEENGREVGRREVPGVMVSSGQMVLKTPALPAQTKGKK
jgi:hypothetical protein